MDVPPVGHPEYLNLLDELKELHCRKAADNGRGEDPFANVRAGAEFGVPAWVGVMIRANDKMHRVKSFIQNGGFAQRWPFWPLPLCRSRCWIGVRSFRTPIHSRGIEASDSVAPFHAMPSAAHTSFATNQMLWLVPMHLMALP